MKYALFLLLLPCLLHAQKTNRQLVALVISYDPDQTDAPNKYYLIAGKPSYVKLKENQTFLLQSAWHSEGDSIVSIGEGTVNTVSDTGVTLNAVIYAGKKIQKGDMALFLVPLEKPETDTLFFKMGRLGILFKSLTDSNFYDRNTVLVNPSAYPTSTLLEAMAADIRRTGEAMIQINNNQDQKIKSGIYKDQMLFTMMTKATSEDVLQFMFYVYAKPDKYKAHEWKISETFATWVINGAPQVISKPGKNI